MNSTRVLIAEDHALVRAGFRALLSSCAGVHVVAETGDGRQTLRLVQEVQPDVILMDISMPGLNGLEATARVVSEYPQIRVIILSMHADEEYVLQALQAGASGYLLKDSDAAELELAIAAVVRGETYLSPQVSKRVIADYLRLVGDESTSQELLTPRQREVLQLIAEGHTTKQIAQILSVSEKTAMTHRAQLMERLDIHDIAGLVRYAIRIGLVSPEG
jgi:DNA-binding NarL/FixJ family response regulator